MHKYLPKLFIFIDQYNSYLFENNNINTGIIYRNYNSRKREEDLYEIVKACKKKRYKIFISNDIKLAIKFKADGIYIPSFNKIKQFGNLENKNLIILGSAHNQKEIQEKISQKCTGIFLAPLFKMKKYKQSLGLCRFNYLTYKNDVNFFALGGIN